MGELITLILNIMELKVDEIITYNNNNETIQLVVIPTKANSCEDCFFYKNYHYYNLEEYRNLLS